jgi:Ca2+-binding RTX toxin-like protein
MGARRILLATCLVLLAATTYAPMAGAASLRDTSDGWRYVGGGEDNAVIAIADGTDLVLTDTGAAALDSIPAGCTDESAGIAVAVRCSARGQQELRITLGDGNDTITAFELPRRFTLDADVGNGDNVVEGGSGDDRIVGGIDRDTLYGGPGDDFVSGGAGNDYVRGNGGGDDVRGGDGLNFLFGDGGDDVLRGGSEFEYFTGGRGNDVILAGGGADDIGAGAGDDIVYGGAGDDEIRGGAGADRMYGEAGADLLRSRDGEADRLDCGGGADVARIDAGSIDSASRSCEQVKRADAVIVDPPDVDVIE